MTAIFTAPDGIQRDGLGRPLIVPPDGGKPVAYTRVSTLAKALDDKNALMQWKCRQTAIGMAVRPDLVSMAAAKPDDRRALNEVVKSALAAAESDKAANIGTALHAFTEKVDDGADPSDLVPAGDPMLADLIAYRDATAGIRMEAAELFVVIDELQAAGSFDRLATIPSPYGLLVADLKSGQHEPDYPHGVTQQIAMYARGTLYKDGQRIAPLADLGVNQSWGLMIHLPAGQGRCDLYLLDLDHGWALAQTAVAVRQAYKRKPLTAYHLN